MAGIKILQRRLGRYKRDSIRLTMESTGNMWIVMYESLEKRFDVSLANPIKTKAIAEAKIKNDKLDAAAVLADLARADLIAKCYVPDRGTREVRDLIRHRIDLVSQKDADQKPGTQHA